MQDVHVESQDCHGQQQIGLNSEEETSKSATFGA
jgi:hypothetical protein